VIVPVAILVTAFEVTTNVEVEDPVAITTEGGTEASVVVDSSEIVSPPPGAAPLRLTVPVAEAPPGIGLGLIVRPVSEAGVNVKVAEAEVPP